MPIRFTFRRILLSLLVLTSPLAMILTGQDGQDIADVPIPRIESEPISFPSPSVRITNVRTMAQPHPSPPPLFAPPRTPRIASTRAVRRLPGISAQSATEQIAPGMLRNNQSVDQLNPLGAWWNDRISQPQGDQSTPLPVDLLTLTRETILHSQHVQAVSTQVKVRETTIAQSDADFDPAAFIDTRWLDVSEPVGSFLTTGGGPSRYSQEQWTGIVGFRRKSRIGGNVEVAQRIGTEDTNSNFFIPSNQATSRLSVSLNQPLLAGAGKAYNESLILLAIHDTSIAEQQFRTSLQNQLIQVITQYWELYFHRASMLIQQSALEQASTILENVLGRAEFDSYQSQIARAQATVANRRAQLTRAKASIRNAEARLRALTNSPLFSSPKLELLPTQLPQPAAIDLSDSAARQVALDNRPEVAEAMTRIKAAGVRVGVSKNEMLPTLGLVLESYVNGLNGNYALDRSLGDQFADGAPSYTAGLVAEMPLGRRQSRARYTQRLLELQQAEHEFADVIATLSADVEIARRDVDTAWQVLIAQQQAALATATEVEHLQARLDNPAAHQGSTSFLLEELLDAIDRLVRDETQLALAHRNYAVAIAEFNRATGLLLSVDVQQSNRQPTLSH